MTIPTIESRRFTVGKYEIIATPMPYSAHMLRYIVFADGKRIGVTASVPGEADCKFLENPPIIPPLVAFQSSYRPGRPKKGTPPRSTEPAPAPREELPHGMALPQSTEEL
jgi:hypothetical protein